MTLSGINAWARAAAKSQADVYRWAKRQGGADQQPVYKPPPSPDHLIAAIERMIEAAPRERASRTLGAVVSHIQVLWARVSDTTNFGPANIREQMFSIDDNLLKAATIYTLAESLYDDARKLSDGVPEDFGRMKSVLNILDLRDGPFPDTHAYLARRAERYRLARRRGYERLWDWAKTRWNERFLQFPVDAGDKDGEPLGNQ
jgi:hypothetical protein